MLQKYYYLQRCGLGGYVLDKSKYALSCQQSILRFKRGFNNDCLIPQPIIFLQIQDRVLIPHLVFI